MARTLTDDASPIAILGHKEPELLIAFLGTIKAGHPYMPIDTAQPPPRVHDIVTRSGARLTLSPEIIRALPDAPSPTTTRRLAPADPYYILFTSGSTGEPKGVVITLANVTNFLEWMLGQQDFEQGREGFLNQVLYSFDVSVMDTYLALLTGGTVYSVTREQVANPKQLFESLAAADLTIWVSTPSFVQMCLVEKTFRAEMLPRLRRFFLAGEILAPEVVSQLLERFPRAQVWNAYGPTETTVIVAWVNVTRDLLAKYSPLPIGYALARNRLLVLDESGNQLPTGERGEIIIAGPSVSPGYLGRPDLTEKAFFTYQGMRAYHTGDWGRFRDGMLFYEGRMDSQVKLHGYRIELGDVETNLRALPGVQDAVVIPVLRAGVVDSLAAFVILTNHYTGSDFEMSTALRHQLAERLPAYMLPRKFFFVQTFPMNANGKADRRRLAEALLVSDDPLR